MRRKHPKKSMWYEAGYRAGWWFEENKHSLVENLFKTVIYRIPGGRWLSRFF